MQTKLSLIFFMMVGILTIGCERDKPHGPYDPSNHHSKFAAKIDNVNFEPYQITIATPDDPKIPIGVFARDSNYLINIYIPRDCGKKTFDFPNTDQSAGIAVDNLACKSGKLTITKYDFNLVEGIFECDVISKNSTLIIKEGSFSIVYILKSLFNPKNLII